MNTDTREKNIDRKTIYELFENFDGEYIPQEIDWGNPVGKEKFYEDDIIPNTDNHNLL